MSILDLLKEKSVEEKENFLNSVRSKVSSKLKNTDNNKILDVISLVDAFSSSLSVVTDTTGLFVSSSAFAKFGVTIDNAIINAVTKANIFFNFGFIFNLSLSFLY